MQAKQKQLLNLLARGRALHWGNHVTIARRSFAKKAYPQQPPPLVDFVYRAGQFVMSADLMARRAYLGEHALAAFAQSLFHALAGPNGERFHKLTDGYANAFEDERAFAGLLARDLCAAMTGGTAPDEVNALLGAPRAMLRTTHLYTAQVFGDRALVRQLS